MKLYLYLWLIAISYHLARIVVGVAEQSSIEAVLLVLGAILVSCTLAIVDAIEKKEDK